MRYKKKLIVLLILVVLVTGIQSVMPFYPAYVTAYDKYVFGPYQTARDIVFSIIPISIGDILYVIALLFLLFLLGRWIYFLIRFKLYKHYLGLSLLHTVLALAIVYLLFFVGWGGNYYKASLTAYWDLDKSEWSTDSTLIAFDRLLVKKLNEYAPYYKPVDFREVNKRAKAYYGEFTDHKKKMDGLHVKASMFGYFMQHFGIQGYYNPFTGEAQVNKHLPSFMLPFVVCHEMAHQAGIASEEDANLLAYALSTEADDTAFNYSAYLNLWLYTNSRLHANDSAVANAIKRDLNVISLAHLDTLREIRRKYKSDLSDYSGQLYDGYLKMHNQKDGIKSYNRVASSAWAWEQRKRKGNIIHLP